MAEAEQRDRQRDQSRLPFHEPMEKRLQKNSLQSNAYVTNPSEDAALASQWDWQLRRTEAAAG
jgi:hypothetical protein